MLGSISQIVTTLDMFARGGGGGSSSGGGGGGVAVIGYVPMHFFGALLRRHSFNKEVWVVWQFIGWLVGITYAILLTLGLHFIGAIAGAGAILGTGAGLYNWFSLLRRSKKTTLALEAAESKDSTWNETEILARAKEVFLDYQKDWSDRNWQNMASYMTPRYHQHATLMIAALIQAHRINAVDDIEIQQMTVVDLRDSTVNDEDSVTVGLTAKAADRLLDDRDQTNLYILRMPFTEFWRFSRSGNSWLLDGIQQATAARWTHNAAMEQFARERNYFYSLDWGWLLIPSHGQLFNKKKFGISDINNHIIGLYKQQFLLQLYTYSPDPHYHACYLIAQTNLPKSYGDIVVRHKKGFHLFGPRGLRKVSMEWGDFNKKYEVYASDTELATSFELLHPAYMEKLEALSFEVNIEVVDNVVYLYAPENKNKAEVSHYEELLSILQEAYKQMEL